MYQVLMAAKRDELRSIGLISALIVVMHCASAAAATDQNANTASSSNAQLQEIVVTSHYEFLSVDTSGTTNLPLAIEKIPQSISLVSSDFIAATDLKTLGDIAEYTPGALNIGDQEGFGTLIALRGFPAAQAIDGVNVGVLGATTTYEPLWTDWSL